MKVYISSVENIRLVCGWLQLCILVLRFLRNVFQTTYSTLLYLFLVAKRKALFDDRPREIEELTYIIKQDINGLNEQIAQLQQV